MLCCHCKKNQATKTHERVLVGGGGSVKEVAYYCLDCYHRLVLSRTEESERLTSVCPRCGMTAKEFLRTKLVGCAECYRVLASDVLPVTVKMQGCEEHFGVREIVSEKERLVKRAHELQIVYDKMKSLMDGDQKKRRAKEIAELRERIAAIKEEGK